MGDASIQPAEASTSGAVCYADATAAGLIAPHLDILNSPEAFEGPDVVRVKQNASRTVWRCRLGEECFYLKQYRVSTPTQRLRNLLRGDSARREMALSEYLRSCGVPATPVVAIGRAGKHHWMLSRAIEPSEPADAWQARRLESSSPRVCRQVRQVTLALAELIARMHKCGVLHHDLHCGNVLVQFEGEEPQLTLMDLHRASRRRQLSRRACARNLAQLLHDRGYWTSRTQRLAFLKRYLDVLGASGTLRGWGAMVEQFAQQYTRASHAARDRRCVGRNKYFTPLRIAGGWHGHAVLASKRRLGPSNAAALVFTPPQWAEALREPEKLFDSADAVVIKDAAGSLVVRRSLAVGPHVLDVYIKRHRRKHWYKAVCDVFRPSRAIRAFRSGHALLTRRIATALPLAAMERRTGPFLCDTLLITEAVAPADPLKHFLNRWLGPEAVQRQSIDLDRQHQLARGLLRQLGRILRRLHTEGFAHRDLKSSNLLIHWTAGQDPEVVLVDLDGLSHHRRISARRMFQGIMRLNVSLLECTSVNHAGRLRMLMGYLRHPGSGRVNFKPYWRELEQWTARKLQHQLEDRRKRQKRSRR